VSIYGIPVPRCPIHYRLKTTTGAPLWIARRRLCLSVP
jgi:hypothetical protein